MKREEAARILDPMTREEALAPYKNDCQARQAASEEAIRIAVQALRETDTDVGGKNIDVPTNADRIRAMSDEELADFMVQIVGNAVLCKALGTEPKFFTVEWLQQPAKENEV